MSKIGGPHSGGNLVMPTFSGRAFEASGIAAVVGNVLVLRFGRIAGERSVARPFRSLSHSLLSSRLSFAFCTHVMHAICRRQRDAKYFSGKNLPSHPNTMNRRLCCTRKNFPHNLACYNRVTIRRAECVEMRGDLLNFSHNRQSSAWSRQML